MHRPTLLLHTNEFEKQSDDLTREDWEATWSVVEAMERGIENRDAEMMILYNCGVDAGSSQGHKHLQILRVEKSDFQVWVEEVELSGEL